MKSCPICQIANCAHERRFYVFGLAKAVIVQKSLEATVALFSRLMTFIPTNAEMAYKINFIEDDLRKCQERMNDVKKWLEHKISV